MKKRLVSMLLGTLIVTASLSGCGRKTPAGPVVSLPTSVVSEEQTLDSASESETENSEESTSLSEESKESSTESSVESKEEGSEAIESSESSESEVPDEREPHESSEESKESESKEESASSKPSESKEQSKPSESKEQSKPAESKPSEPTTPSVPTTPNVPESSAPSESTTPSVPESSTPSEPAHTHSYVTTTISEATCQKAKVVADVCSCGDKINEHEEGEKKAHVLGYTEYPPGWEPDCTHGGMEYCYCANCGEAYGYNIVGTAPHDEELHVQRGNCVSPAHLIYTCKNCGIKRSEDSYDAQYRDDHVWLHGEGKYWNADEECWYYYETDQCDVCNIQMNRVELGPREE